MPVVVKMKYKYRGLARARIKFTMEMCTRIVKYNVKHPTMKIGDEVFDNSLLEVLEQLLAAYNAKVPA